MKKIRNDMSYQEINSQTIDRWSKEGWEWARPISHEEYVQAEKGIWNVKLTPVKYVPHEWFGELKGKHILGLASGGGQQMPVFTSQGAVCTVLDYSSSQIESEISVANREGYKINTVIADMTKPLPFEDGSFDLIFHPVSNCYVADVYPIWKECSRVLKKNGLLLSGFDNGVNFLMDSKEKKVVWSMPFDPLHNEKQRRFLEKTDSGMQFSHTIEELIGGQLKAGFVLKDVYSDTNGEGRLYKMNVPCYWATLCVKA